MSNIGKAFANGKAFIPFLTCGDPDLETTAAAVRAAAGQQRNRQRDFAPFFLRTSFSPPPGYEKSLTPQNAVPSCVNVFICLFDLQSLSCYNLFKEGIP